MAQPLPPEPPGLPEAPEGTAGAKDGHSPIRLLQDPPERKVTGPRPRPRLRNHGAAATAGDGSPLPPRGAGMTVISYPIAGLLAYGGIGWLVSRAVHLPVLFPVGMLIGLGLSLGLVIHRYGRSSPPRDRRAAPAPAKQNEQNEQADDNDARGTHR
jgi:hypothetical protein